MASILFPSTSINKYASTPSSMVKLIFSISAESLNPCGSINSQALGLPPAKNIPFTASQAFSGDEKGANINNVCCGCGISFNTILVTIPKVPSLPINKCVRLYPVEYLSVFAPVQITSPVGKTTSKFNT